MRFGSLFSGIGGMDLGLERAGMECAWQVEIDGFCRKVLTKHWPNVPKYNDVRECGKHNLERVDLIAGGFPCQDISNAGKRAGIDGERSGLWSEFHRIICELRPRYVLVENVAALLVRGFGRVLGDLAANGYDAEWRVFSACEMGFPHSRERLFLVAYPTSIRRETTVLGYSLKTLSGISITRERCKDWLKLEMDHSPLVAETWGPKVCGSVKPGLLRIVDGVPRSMDISPQLKGYGNAVMPPIAEWIGRRIIEGDSQP